MNHLLSPWLVLLGFLAIAAFFLLTEHRAHVFGVVPYLLLLACPLMHFMHREHGRHDSHRGADHNEHRDRPAPRPGADAAPGGPKP
jgi:Protein of unknown function (DUF2933)